MKKIIKVGLTGGIGSGKTTVAGFFEKLGIPVYYADMHAKILMQENPDIKKELIKVFGNKVYQNNHLNRSYLASIVFSDKDKLYKLEQIVHPSVRKDFIKWTEKQKAPYVIVENAILHKSGMDKLVDYVIVVTSDTQKRIERLKKRDKVDNEQIQKRINNQESNEELLKKADFIIKNNKNLDSLGEKVKLIDLKLKNSLNKS